MDIDLSWSHFFKTDAPTLVKDTRDEVKKHMDFITSSLSKFDNVSRALSEGHRMLGNVLCKKCLVAVKSKRTEIHSKKKTSHKKKQMMKLSPERQQIVNDISNVFMKLERPQSENQGEEEYCTQEDYYQQDMIEMENMHTDKIIKMREEMMEIENKYKKEFKDKEVELRDTRKDLQKMTIERDDYKRENETMSVTLKKREDNKRYTSSSSGYKTSFVFKNQDADVARLQDDLTSTEEELQRSTRDNEKLKSEHSKMIENLEKEMCSLKVKLDSNDKDTQKFKTENESLKMDYTELLKQVEELQEQNCSLQKKLGRKDDELKSVKSQLEVLQKAKRKQIEETPDDCEETQTEEDENELSQLKKERAILQDQTDSLTREYMELSSTIDGLQRDVDTVTRLLGEKKYELERAERKNEKLLQDKIKVQTEKETLQDQVSSLHQTNEELLATKDILRRTIDRLTGQLDKKTDDFEKARKENDAYEKALSKLQKERELLQDQIDSFTKANTELSSTIDCLQWNVDILTVELKEKQHVLDRVLKEHEEHVAQSRTKTEDQGGPSVNRTNEELLITMEGLQRTIDRLTGKLEENQSARNKGQEENEGYIEDEIAKLQTEKQSLLEQTGSFIKTIEEKQSTMDSLQRDVNRLKKELDEKQEELDEALKENELNVKDKCQLETERKAILDQTRSLKGTVANVSSTMEGLQRGIDRLIGELVETGRNLPLEECRILQKKALVLRLLRTSRSGLGKTMIDIVTKELTRQLGQRPDSRSFEYSIVLHETVTEVSKGPLFVVCLSSMVGRNVPDALEGPKGGRAVYLLVLHQTSTGNLPTLTPTSLRVTGSEQLGGTIDMVFSSDIGLFECDLNTNAVDKIVKVLKKY